MPYLTEVEVRVPWRRWLGSAFFQSHQSFSSLCCGTGHIDLRSDERALSV